MKVGTKILIVILAIVSVCCISIDGWYLYIYLVGSEKTISKTFKVDGLTLADGSQIYFMELEYFANSNNTGYEAFEIKFNYYMDDDKTIYTHGLQYISESSIDFEFSHNDIKESKVVDSSGSLGWKKKYYNCQNSYVPSSSTKVYDYASFENSQYLFATNPINLNTYFKIEIGDDLYLMQFKGVDTPMDATTEMGTVRTYHNIWHPDIYHNMYYIYDINYMSMYLFNAVKTGKYGTNEDYVFEFGNWFNYYKSNGDGTYSENKTDYDNVVKLSGDIRSYYKFRIKLHENGLTRSQDSMFNSIAGNQSLNLTDDYVGEDYFVGRTIIDCNISSFDFVTVVDNNVALKLKDAFISYYDKYKKLIKLNVVIDLDLMNELGYTFVGFTSDSGLDNFEIYKCCTTSGGTITDYSEVQDD